MLGTVPALRQRAGNSLAGVFIAKAALIGKIVTARGHILPGSGINLAVRVHSVCSCRRFIPFVIIVPRMIIATESIAQPPHGVISFMML